MKASFEGRVHSAAVRSFDKKAALADGREVIAQVPGVTFEVVSADHGHTFHLEALSAEHLDEMNAAIKAGKRVTVSVEIHDEDEQTAA